ncbi:MAG TPA: DUF2142 domain-containing protein, partial [Solirubrobacteraceae bacterium]
MSALRSIPRPALACAVAALLNLLAWSLLTPPFHVPDEIAHFSYAQTLAETGRPPVTQTKTVYSPQEEAALAGTYFYGVIGQPRNFPTATPAEQAKLGGELARHPGRLGNRDANVATSQPPLYYAIEDVPYAAARSGSIFTQLALMRAVSCLFGVATVLLCFGFVREVLPGEPRAWGVGALAVSFLPLFAFISSGVNPDAMLYAAAAGLFWAVAATFRRGLTPARGAALGAAVAVGALAKLNFLGFLPGVALAVLYLAWRDSGRPGAIRGALFAAGVAALPLAVYVLLNVSVWDRPAIGFGGITALAQPGTGGGATSGRSLGGLLSYLWQLYLPRLPFMQTHWFQGIALHRLWFDGLVGRFGWLDYGFPAWVYNAALVVAGAVLALVVAALVRLRGALRGRGAEAVAYVLMVAGLLFVIGRAGYQSVTSGQGTFQQARYLLPLLAPYAALVALAARAGGRRWVPVLGVAFVLVAFAHDLFAG